MEISISTDTEVENYSHVFSLLIFLGTHKFSTTNSSHLELRSIRIKHLIAKGKLIDSQEA
jgi:hypothetical protein